MALPSPSSEPKRSQLFADTRVQGPIVWRVVLVCVLTATATAASFALRDWLFEPGGWLYWILPWLCTMAVAVPLAAYEAARFTNRLVGPMVRLQGKLRDIADGEEFRPVRFRPSDPWNEWAEDFNDAIIRLTDRIRSSQDPCKADHS